MHELTFKLRKGGFSTAVIEEAVAELEDRGLLDDTRLARDAVTGGQRAGRSRARIYADLRRRGIAREDAEVALQDCFDPEEELKTVAGFMRKSLSGSPATVGSEEIDKTARRLFKRGFSASAIAGALEGLHPGEGGCHVPHFLDSDNQLS